MQHSKAFEGGEQQGRRAVAVSDSSALHFWTHCDMRCDSESAHDGSVLLNGYARSASELGDFNVDHPLFGGGPISVLVPTREMRIHTKKIKGCLCKSVLPKGSFTMLREGLYIATPELVFVRMGNHLSEVKLVEIGTNLCARYYIEVGDAAICDRRKFLTDPDHLKRYAKAALEVRGSNEALRALRWVLPNSGSPMETKMQLLFRLPMGKGGLALPFTDMNFIVSDRRSAHFCEQEWYSIDLASPRYKTGLEYDGVAYHQVASDDKRRRNALKGLGWEIFPVDKAILFDPEATERLAYQIARHMQVRLQKPKTWEAKYSALRRELGLPA